MMWGEFILYAALFIVVGALIQWLLRKLLSIEKKKIFSYNHVNDLHKRIDWTIRIGTVIGGIISVTLAINNEYSIYVYMAVLLGFGILTEGVRAFFEWKYSETPKHSILTIGEIIYITIVIVAIIQFDLFSSWT
ncbi:DUF4181 domain-containing protein [Sporosarcina sp. NPDC096371]|uniref:DUF4181 domain-containing protein n=1 Tax=Sporosarcina sp. NPDC096371 TaxID=3364530 RepID=UPI0038063F13